MIEVSHLSKKYGTHPAIEDLSFTVGDGQIFGLLGPNGAGKSTIMNILTGYLAPTSGEVKVAGFSLPEQAQQAKACVGYLPEQPPLYPEMTVQEYLDFAAELKGIKKKADRKEQVRKAARRTGWKRCCPGSSAVCPRATASAWALRRHCWARRSSSFWTSLPWALTLHRSSRSAD